MTSDQEEHFLLHFPCRKRNQEAVVRIPAPVIERPNELLRHRNEVAVRKRTASDPPLKVQLSDSQMLCEWRRLPAGATQTGGPKCLLIQSAIESDLAEYLGPGTHSAMIEHARTIPNDRPAISRLSPATSHAQDADDHDLALRS